MTAKKVLDHVNLANPLEVCSFVNGLGKVAAANAVHKGIAPEDMVKLEKTDNGRWVVFYWRDERDMEKAHRGQQEKQRADAAAKAAADAE